MSSGFPNFGRKQGLKSIEIVESLAATSYLSMCHIINSLTYRLLWAARNNCFSNVTANETHNEITKVFTC